MALRHVESLRRRSAPESWRARAAADATRTPGRVSPCARCFGALGQNRFGTVKRTRLHPARREGMAVPVNRPQPHADVSTNGM